MYNTNVFSEKGCALLGNYFFSCAVQSSNESYYLRIEDLITEEVYFLPIQLPSGMYRNALISCITVGVLKETSFLGENLETSPKYFRVVLAFYSSIGMAQFSHTNYIVQINVNLKTREVTPAIILTRIENIIHCMSYVGDEMVFFSDGFNLFSCKSPQSIPTPHHHIEEPKATRHNRPEQALVQNIFCHKDNAGFFLLLYSDFTFSVFNSCDGKNFQQASFPVSDFSTNHFLKKCLTTKKTFYLPEGYFVVIDECRIYQENEAGFVGFVFRVINPFLPARLTLCNALSLPFRTTKNIVAIKLGTNGGLLAITDRFEKEKYLIDIPANLNVSVNTAENFSASNCTASAASGSAANPAPSVRDTKGSIVACSIHYLSIYIYYSSGLLEVCDFVNKQKIRSHNLKTLFVDFSHLRLSANKSFFIYGSQLFAIKYTVDNENISEIKTHSQNNLKTVGGDSLKFFVDDYCCDRFPGFGLECVKFMDLAYGWLLPIKSRFIDERLIGVNKIQRGFNANEIIIGEQIINLENIKEKRSLPVRVERTIKFFCVICQQCLGSYYTELDSCFYFTDYIFSVKHHANYRVIGISPHVCHNSKKVGYSLQIQIYNPATLKYETKLQVEIPNSSAPILTYNFAIDHYQNGGLMFCVVGRCMGNMNPTAVECFIYTPQNNQITNYVPPQVSCAVPPIKRAKTYDASSNTQKPGWI
jgi:hypothetical protein